jgi:hypothetical protein
MPATVIFLDPEDPLLIAKIGFGEKVDIGHLFVYYRNTNNKFHIFCNFACLPVGG